MILLALDPGPVQTGWCLWKHGKFDTGGIAANDDVLQMIRTLPDDGMDLAIEMIASYGMPVGREVFETCVWIGRFVQAWTYIRQSTPQLVYRKDVKMHLCGSPRAKDPNIRQALIDKLGPPGTKAKPGGTYGVKSHIWPALAVAVTFAETRASAVHRHQEAAS